MSTGDFHRLFASTDLAARIERAECNLLMDGAASVSNRLGTGSVFVRPIAGGVAVLTVDGSPLNKLAGLGFGGAIDVAELEAIESAFSKRGLPLQVELSNLADPSVGALLTRRGYTLEGFENVLGRLLPAKELQDRVEPSVAVSVSGADELDEWIDVVVTGFATPDTQGVASHESFERKILEEAIADMASAKAFVRYVARLEGELAGGASMRVSESVAQLTGAATLPEKRRRGVQSALLSKRLADAGASGCDVAVVTTQPGSKSQENVQRRGFELVYTRAVLVKASD